MVNALAIISGMICDGAKASCAGKTFFYQPEGQHWSMICKISLSVERMPIFPRRPTLSSAAPSPL